MTLRCVLVVAACLPFAARGAEGPGFPNVNYGADQEGDVLALMDLQKGVNITNLVRGYLFVVMNADHGGGKGSGAFAFYDVSDPSNPQNVFDSRNIAWDYWDSNSVNYAGDFGEAHHVPISDNYILLAERRPTSSGYAILDVSNLFDNHPLTRPLIVSRYSLPGVTNPAAYDGWPFAPAWQGQKYLWAATGTNGLFVIDTSDFANPQQVTHIPKSQLSDFTLRNAIAIGNLLILTSIVKSESIGMEALFFDISDPANPQIINTISAGEGVLGYQPYVYGSGLYPGGEPMVEYDFTDPYNLVETTLVASPGLTEAEYGFGKDNYLFVGHDPGMSKWERDGASTTLVGEVLSGLNDNHAIGVPMGNLIVMGSDHNNDRTMIIGIHDHQKDETPPAVNFSSPADGETNVHVKSRVGFCFTDFIDHWTVNSSTFVVREFGTGTPVPGTYSTMFGIVNFCPDADLTPNTTYEVVLTAGGITDQVGNAATQDTTLLFSTGAAVNSYGVTVVPDVPREAGVAANLSVTVENLPGFTLEHAWDFGDGTPVTAYGPATAVSHTYAAPGNHVVTVHTRIVGETHATLATGVQVTHHPIASEAPLASSTIVYDAANGLVWNVNPDNDTVCSIDAVTYLSNEIAVGANPRSLAIGPANDLWVVNRDDATISVIDRVTGVVVQTHSLPYASAPYGIVIDVPGGAAYIALEATGQVAKVDTGTGLVTSLLDVGEWPRGLAFDATRDRLWVTRFISPDSSGEVYAIDTTTFTLAGTVPLAPVLDPDGAVSGRGLPNYLGAIGISPDVTQAFVPAKKDNIYRGILRDGLQLTQEHTVRSMAGSLDLAGESENTGRRIDFDDSDFASAVAFSPLGNRMFFATSGSETIWVVDAYVTDKRFSFSSGGHAPSGLVMSPDGSRLFVHNYLSRTVAVFDTSMSCGAVCGTSPQLASVPTVASEQLAPDVLQGKRLFYTTSDPRMSQEGYMSCASCHLDGGHDGRNWDFTGFGEGVRNTISLLGRGTGHGPVHWTANFDEVHDFEGQIRGLSSGTGLMAYADFHDENRSAPMGTAKAGLSGDLDALAAYVASLTGAGKSPHRNSDGSLTADALAGRAIFIAKGCASCHHGGAFTDSVSLARHDVGTVTPDSGQRMGMTLDGLDTPTLRGLWASAPYLHDGSASRVRDVLTMRNLSGKHGHLFDLSELEIDQLEAYLLQVDDLEASAPESGLNQPPAFGSAPGDRLSNLHEAVYSPLSVTDPESDPLEFFATGLPVGVALDRHTGIISGAPQSEGEHGVTVGVRDAAGNSISASFKWTVWEAETLLSEVVAAPSGPWRYVRLVALSNHKANPFISVAEFNVLDENGLLADRTGWVATASSEELATVPANPASAAVDGVIFTFWHTEWALQTASPPQDLTVDFGSQRLVSGFKYVPRFGNDHGWIKDYEFYGSNDAVAWTLLATGSFPRSGAEQRVFLSPMAGAATLEYWTSTSGAEVSDLLKAKTFPDRANLAYWRVSTVAFSGIGDFYGSRMHGYVVPPVTGDYTFWIAADDTAELWLSPDAGTANASLIAHVHSLTDPQEWGKFPWQQSAPVTLEAGVMYYFRALHKEGVNNDHFAVAWSGPTIPGPSLIDGQYLVPYQELPPAGVPVFPVESYAFGVLENAASGTVVGVVGATDPDPGDNLSYDIATGNTGDVFSLDPVTGVIEVDGALDFESQSEYILTVGVIDDSASLYAKTIEVVITVGNVFESNGEVVYVQVTQPSGVFEGHGNPALIGFDADPDGDGVPTSIEVLTGTDPSVMTAPPGMRLGSEEEGGQVYATYEIDVDASVEGAMVYRFLLSSDLQTWEEAINPPVLVLDAGGVRTWRVRDHVPVSGAAARFVKVSIAEGE